MGADQRLPAHGEPAVGLSFWDARYCREHHCLVLDEDRFGAQVRSFVLCQCKSPSRALRLNKVPGILIGSLTSSAD
jgi:hypothetical protein